MIPSEKKKEERSKKRCQPSVFIFNSDEKKIEKWPQLTYDFDERQTHLHLDSSFGHNSTIYYAYPIARSSNETEVGNYWRNVDIDPILMDESCFWKRPDPETVVMDEVYFRGGGIETVVMDEILFWDHYAQLSNPFYHRGLPTELFSITQQKIGVNLFLEKYIVFEVFFIYRYPNLSNCCYSFAPTSSSLRSNTRRECRKPLPQIKHSGTD